MFNLNKRLSNWAMRVRIRKLDNLMSEMASIETYIEYLRLREDFGNA